MPHAHPLEPEPEPNDLPPLALLRAFDAAGRHLSFKTAASSLHVSASTISHQIADLEHYLGVQLFQRQARQLSLTAEGSALLAEVSVAFSQLRTASTRLRTRGQPMVIRISANPFLASEILMPLIEAFERDFPGRSIHLSATETMEDPRDGVWISVSALAMASGPGWNGWLCIRCLRLR